MGTPTTLRVHNFDTNRTPEISDIILCGCCRWSLAVCNKTGTQASVYTVFVVVGVVNPRSPNGGWALKEPWSMCVHRVVWWCPCNGHNRFWNDSFYYRDASLGRHNTCLPCTVSLSSHPRQMQWYMWLMCVTAHNTHTDLIAPCYCREWMMWVEYSLMEASFGDVDQLLTVLWPLLQD